MVLVVRTSGCFVYKLKNTLHSGGSLCSTSYTLTFKQITFGNICEQSLNAKREGIFDSYNIVWENNGVNNIFEVNYIY